MLNWANQFNICCFLDNNNYSSPYHQYEVLLGADALQTLEINAGNAFHALQEFQSKHQDWLFGHLAYDLKNEVVTGLQSTNYDGIGFPDMFFFRPRIVLLLQQGQVHIGGEAFSEQDAHTVYTACLRMLVNVKPPATIRPQPLQARLDYSRYIGAVKDLQQHIVHGDCYEINFCRESFMEGINVYPPALFTQLNALSPAPMAAFYRLHDKYLACSSPERFMQKRGDTVISQPIKGTCRKDIHSEVDRQLRQKLFHSAKERAENVMVVDLVRNDLSHTALPGSVKVAELFGVYSFAQVHHLISTISSQLPAGMPATEVLRTAFPMGSMTGAPKIRVMQLIEQYEQTRRGLFSGAIGYFTPSGNVDFNVVIRSMLYNATGQYLSFQTGSAVTFYSDPEKEWEECLLKAAVMEKIISG